jgi:TolB-like protein/Tfp pilus assembly protein PilF
VHRCLEKNPANRYQAAKELISALEESALASQSPWVGRPWRWYATASFAAVILVVVFATLEFNIGGWRDRLRLTTGSMQIDSLAVLPFANVSGDAGQDYFVDGMTDQLITDLAQIARLRVTSRTSAMQFKDRKKPVPQIARDLNVDAVVEGSVMHSGDRVRITAQLIEAKTDRHLWARSYERNSQDIMAMQDELARDIAEEIRVKLTPQEQTRLIIDKKTNPRSYDAYLRGRYLLNQRNAEAIAKARGYFQQAVQEDPNFAPSYSGLADCYSLGWGAKRELPLAEEYARKAISLQPDLAEAYVSLGMAILHQYRAADAELELKRALELNPNLAMAHHTYGGYLLTQGRPADALVENDRARELDPFSFPVNVHRGVILIGLRQYDRAIDQLEKTAELNPQSPAPHTILARIYWLQGKAQEAIAEGSKAATLSNSPERVRDQQEVAATYGKVGLPAARLKAAQLMERNYKGNYDAVDIALQYGTLEDKNKVMQWLEQSFHDREGNLLWLKTAPEFDFARADPSYAGLVRRLGLPP